MGEFDEIFSNKFEISNIDVNDLFEANELQDLQDIFAKTNDVASLITNSKGVPLTNPSNFTRLCKDIIRKTEKGCANCIYSDSILGKYVNDGPIIQPCLSGGLWDAAASITVGGKHIATWLIGQIINDEIDENRIIEYADVIGADKEEFIAALKEVPRMSIEKFTKISQMLYVFANQLSEKAYNNFLLKRQIEEHKKDKDLLEESKENISITLNSIGDGVITTDLNGLIMNINPIAANLCGCHETEAIGKPLLDVFKILNAHSRIKIGNPVEKVLKTGKISGQSDDTILVSKFGQEYMISDTAAPIKNSLGEIKGVVLVFSDVTDKYNAEKIIRLNEKKFSSLFTNMNEGVALHELIFDESGNPIDYKIIDTNRAFESQLGISSKDVIGKQSRTAYDVEEPPYFDIYLDVVLTGKSKVFETYFPPLKKHFSISVYQTYRNGFATIFEDITIRKRNEEALKEEQQISQFLLDNLPGIFYLFSYPELELSRWNKNFESVFGYNKDELAHMNISKLFNPNTQELIISAIEGVIENGINKVEASVLSKNGNEIPFILTGVSLDIKDKKYIMGIGLDNTEQKQAELEIQYKNKELQRLNGEKDKLFSIIAHDLRSPFNSIIGFSSLLLEEIEDNEYGNINQYANIIQQSSQRAMSLLVNLMDWSKAQTGRFEFSPMNLEIDTLIGEALLLLKTNAEQKSITFSLNLESPTRIFADKGMISTVLRNLISNAIKFTFIKGEILISTKQIQNEIIVSIKDNGVGIHKDKIGSLFNSSENFTTNGTANEKGTGLGLLLCKEFVERHKGKIGVESEIGHGSTFYFTIPNN